MATIAAGFATTPAAGMLLHAKQSPLVIVPNFIHCGLLAYLHQGHTKLRCSDRNICKSLLCRSSKYRQPTPSIQPSCRHSNILNNTDISKFTLPCHLDCHPLCTTICPRVEHMPSATEKISDSFSKCCVAVQDGLLL